MRKHQTYHPDARRCALLDRDSRTGVCVELTDRKGALIAGGDYLTLIGEATVIWRKPWCEIQHVSWDRDTGALQIVFTDPTVVPVVFSNPATEWLAHFGVQASAKIRTSMVVEITQQRTDGTTIRAQVRRDLTGELFSQVIGTPGEASERESVNELENKAREMAGLDPI